MSPVGGVGINYAVQDAVEAANLLAAPLAKPDLPNLPLPLRILPKIPFLRSLPPRILAFGIRRVRIRD